MEPAEGVGLRPLCADEQWTAALAGAVCLRLGYGASIGLSRVHRLLMQAQSWSCRNRSVSVPRRQEMHLRRPRLILRRVVFECGLGANVITLPSPCVQVGTVRENRLAHGAQLG